MQGSNKKDSPIIEKVTCPLCRSFFGFVRADGTGPFFDSCPQTEAARCDNAAVRMLVGEGKHKEANKLVKTLDLSPPPCPMEAKLTKYQRKPRQVTPGGAPQNGSGRSKGAPKDETDCYDHYFNNESED